MPRAVSVLVVLVGIALSASRCAASSWQHEAYIWQRQWTPALFDALDEADGLFAGYRVLAAESNRRGALQPIEPAFAELLKSERALTAVIRINGSDPPPDARDLRARIDTLVRDWRAHGLPLVGVEIDHDCAVARLPEYARVLADLRHDWPRDLRLSITALPAWIGAPALPEVLRQVDESVLQVHAVRAPAAGLFDARGARRAIDGYAAVSSQPFRVALPAYGVRVAFDRAGRARAVEAEAPREFAVDADLRELRARPEEVAALLADLAAAPPARLRGVLWFRLPNEQDRRAWSLATLRAVIRGEALAARLEATLETAADGATDVVLVNRGNLDAPLPALHAAARRCLASDGAGGYRALAAPDGWRFVPPADVFLRAGRARRGGWLRCGIVDKVEIAENTGGDETR